MCFGVFSTGLYPIPPCYIYTHVRDPLAPWRFGRAAGLSAGRGLGGGRVRIVARDTLLLNGTVSACGQGPEEPDADRDVLGVSGGV